MCDIFLLGFNR